MENGALHNPRMFTLWEMETPYLRDADIFISIMQKGACMKCGLDSRRRPPGGGQNKYNASYGAMEI